MQRKRKTRRGGTHSTLSLLRKELREGNLQSLFGGSSCIVSSSNAADPKIFSFILPVADDSLTGQSHLSTAINLSKKSSVEKMPERYIGLNHFLCWFFTWLYSMIISSYNRKIVFRHDVEYILQTNQTDKTFGL